jgi:hypothetical protein
MAASIFAIGGIGLVVDQSSQFQGTRSLHHLFSALQSFGDDEHD